MRNRQIAQSDEREESPFIFKTPNSSNVPSAPDLMALKPAKLGYCDKEINNIWVYLFPCWFQKWKRRYFVLIGNYLFRYKNEHGDHPKGVPIPLDSATIRLKDDTCFEVLTIRKTYAIRAESAVEAQNWVAALRERKAQAIKEAMGHAIVSKDVDNVNRAAYSMFNKRVAKDRTDFASDPTRNPMSDLYGGHM